MSKRVEIREWAIVKGTSNPYLAPELRPPRLQGIVTGHPRKADGTLIVTSPIVKADGRLIDTKHTQYVLVGPPSWDYVGWCATNWIDLDPENPLRMP